MNPVRIGTRKSPLAMAQAEWIADRVRHGPTPARVELVGIVTEGDHAGLKSGGAAEKWKGGKGIFVKALDDALLQQTIDLAVHSAKDVPSAIPPGLTVAAVPVREEVGDLLISHDGWSIKSVPTGAKVGTSSLRRAAQILFYRPDVKIVHIRGNVETRISKLLGDSAGYDAILLATAGINRIGGIAKVVEPAGLKARRCDPAEFLPAPGQGALMVISRAADAAGFSFLSDPQTAAALGTERALVEFLGADCSWPVAAWATVEPDGMNTLDAAIFSTDGKLRVREKRSGPDGLALARKLAQALLDKGGKKILEWNAEKQSS